VPDVARISARDENRAGWLAGRTGVQEFPDEALLEDYATGDVRAGALFVRRFGPRVYNLAALIARDRRDAEEVAQDAFVRAWRYAGSFDARRGTVVGWLLGITRNVALDRARVAGRRREQPLPETPFDLADDAAIDPEDAAGRGDELGWVAEQLRALPSGQRDALVAATFHGLTAREIADLSGVPIGTVKTRIRAALRRVRDRASERLACD
jgi:RNA polymerase sigma factor (sigma-70 family)